MPRALIIDDWRKLSKVARKEHDPKKFVYLLKQLYDWVNQREEGQPRHFVRAVGSVGESVAEAVLCANARTCCSFI